MTSFTRVLEKVGPKPSTDLSQNDTRHYSEVFSKEVALWLRQKVLDLSIGQVLNPEGKVDTVFGVGRNGKSLDVGVVSNNGYLLVDFSIKTFNFKDRKTKNYRHNYTGRFYELLGEELDLRRSYPYALLVAVILLPVDSANDTRPSSFAHACRQFSKISRTDASRSFGFDYVFIGLHSESDDIYFFDAGTSTPPILGEPRFNDRLTISAILDKIKVDLNARDYVIASAPLPTYSEYQYGPATI